MAKRNADGAEGGGGGGGGGAQSAQGSSAEGSRRDPSEVRGLVMICAPHTSADRFKQQDRAPFLREKGLVRSRRKSVVEERTGEVERTSTRMGGPA